MKTINEKKVFINSVDQNIRNEFLTNLLINDKKVLINFIQYIEKHAPKPEMIRKTFDAKAFNNDMQTAYNEFKQSLEKLDFEDTDWERWHHDSGHYVPDYEIAMNLAQEEAEDFYDEWHIRLMADADMGSYFEVIAMLCGMFAAAEDADINDPYSNVSDSANDFFLDLLQQDLKTIVEKHISRQTFSNDEASGLCCSIIHFAKDHNKEFIKHLTPLFFSLVQSPDMAVCMLDLLLALSISFTDIPELSDYIITKAGNEKLWLEMAEKIFPDDYALAVKLLDYYYNNKPDDFEKKANIAYSRHRQNLSSFLKDKLTDGSSLYCRFWFDYARNNSSLSAYDQVRRFITREEGIRFAKDIWNTGFQVKILEKERAWDELLTLAKSKHSDDELAIILPSISTIYPEECYTIIKMSAKKIFDMHRNRTGYSQIAGLFKLGLKISEKSVDMRKLIRQYYDHTPRLPALKGEFKKNGLF